VVNVEFPSIKTGDHWILEAKQWVGQIPLPSRSVLRINPRFPLPVLYRMLDSTFRDAHIEIPTGMLTAAPLPEFYERTASLLAKGVQRRGRVGFYKSYVTRLQVGSRIRGRLDFESPRFRPWEINLPLRYVELTEDVPENQVLLRALSLAGRSYPLSPTTHQEVNRAARSLRGSVSPNWNRSATTRRHSYNRLNRDYRQMHGLAEMIVMGSSPGVETGGELSVPFLLDSAKLFERFVGTALQSKLADKMRVRLQESKYVGPSSEFEFRPDIQGSSLDTGEVRFVADTKYRMTGYLSSDEIAQVVTYATLFGTNRAFLIYPIAASDRTVAVAAAIRVTALSLPLDGDIDKGIDQLAADILTSAS
jgi:5-methylcytosine-specific restriction enzyme subunit McrC